MAGASLDQSVKQLPARHRMGMTAFSVYSRAADLGNGILWYAILGIGSVLFTLAAALAAYLDRLSPGPARLLYIASVLAILHTLTTTQAAPINFSQRKAAQDETALAGIFDRFEKWQTLRVVLQVLAFAAMLWAILVLAAT